MTDTLSPHLFPDIKKYLATTPPERRNPHKEWNFPQLNGVGDIKGVYWGHFVQNYAGIEYHPTTQSTFRYATDPERYPGQIGFVARTDAEGKHRCQMVFDSVTNYFQTKAQLLENYETLADIPKDSDRKKGDPMTVMERQKIFTEKKKCEGKEDTEECKAQAKADERHKKYDQFITGELRKTFPSYDPGKRFYMRDNPEFSAQYLYAVARYESGRNTRTKREDDFVIDTVADINVARAAIREEWEFRGRPIPKGFGEAKPEKQGELETDDPMAKALTRYDEQKAKDNVVAHKPDGERVAGTLTAPPKFLADPKNRERCKVH